MHSSLHKQEVIDNYSVDFSHGKIEFEPFDNPRLTSSIVPLNVLMMW